MATNYNSLVSSENKLKEQFYEYLDLTYLIHKKLWDYISSGKLDDSAIADLNNDEEKSDNWERDILDECVWIISKDQPRSSHLRFIISIIYSAKDLERVADYAIDIAEDIISNKVSKEEMDHFKRVSSEYLSFFKAFIEIIKKKNVSEFYPKAKKLKENFLAFYDEEVKKMLKLASSKKPLDFHTITLVMKSIDRSVHHIYNVFSNFRFIKNESLSTKKLKL